MSNLSFYVETLVRVEYCESLTIQRMSFLGTYPVYLFEN